MNSQIMRFGLLLLLTYQTAGAELCRVQLSDDKLIYISSYDTQPIYKDPLGPFQIESTFRGIRKLLGNTKTPLNLQVKIINSETTPLNNAQSDKMILNIGYRFNEKSPQDKEAILGNVSKQFAQKWIELNWSEGSGVLKEFLAEAITATYLGHTQFSKSLSPMTQIYWDTFFSKMAADVNFRRGLILKVWAVLKLNPEIQTAAELKKALEVDFPRFI